MNLGKLYEVFNKLNYDDFVFDVGFANAHSYRGYYDEVAFEPADNVTLAEVKFALNSALGDTHTAWKGGEYEYDMNTPAHLAFKGNADDSDGTELEAVVGNMLTQYLLEN